MANRKIHDIGSSLQLGSWNIAYALLLSLIASEKISESSTVKDVLDLIDKLLDEF